MNLPDHLRRWESLILSTADKYGIDPHVLAGLIDFESGGNPSARNGSSGATGLGQVMPREAGFPGRPSAQELLDPATNLDWSGRILSEGIRRYGSVESGLAAYLGAVDPRTGKPTTATDANGTNGFTYINRVMGAARRYGYGTQTPQLPRTGDATMPDRPTSATTDTLERQRQEHARKVAELRGNLSLAAENIAALTGKTDTESLQALEVTKAQQKRIQEQLDAEQRALADTERRLAAERDKADAPAARPPVPTTRNFGTASEPDWREYDTAAGQWRPVAGVGRTGSAGTAPKVSTFQGRDGYQYEYDPESRTARLIPGQGQPARTLQTLTSPEDGSVWTYDPAQGKLVTQLFGARPEKPGTLAAGNRVYPLDPKTGLPDPSRGVDLRTEEERQAEQRRLAAQGIATATHNGRVTGIDQATGERRYSTDTLTPEERARADEEARLGLDAKRRAAQPQFSDPVAAYNHQVQLARQQGQAKIRELEAQAAADPERLPEFRRSLAEWWQSNIAAPLAGYRAAAERQRLRDEMEMEAAQHQENIRAETANRERERFALAAGEQERARWRQLAPMARSTQFVNEYASNVERMAKGQPVQFSAAAIAAPPVLPDLDQMAREGAARALAAISPTAARQIGKPIPRLPSVSLEELLATAVPNYAPAGAA